MNLAAIDIIGARHPPVSIQLGSCFPKCGALLAALPHLLARRLNHLWSAPFPPTVFEGAFVCICAAYLLGELAKDRRLPQAERMRCDRRCQKSGRYFCQLAWFVVVGGYKTHSVCN
jgi:hypothetical protein